MPYQDSTYTIRPLTNYLCRILYVVCYGVVDHLWPSPTVHMQRHLFSEPFPKDTLTGSRSWTSQACLAGRFIQHCAGWKLQVLFAALGTNEQTRVEGLLVVVIGSQRLDRSFSLKRKSGFRCW